MNAEAEWRLALGRLQQLAGEPPGQPLSPWLAFAVGLAQGEAEALPVADLPGLTAAARDFADDWEAWIGYRDCEIELRPPGAEPLRFLVLTAAQLPLALRSARFAVVTAEWPHGRAAPSAEPNRALADAIVHAGWRAWPAVNAPGTRFAEESFAIFELGMEEAWALGERFGQRGIYYFDRGRPALVARRRGRVVAFVQA